MTNKKQRQFSMIENNLFAATSPKKKKAKTSMHRPIPPHSAVIVYGYHANPFRFPGKTKQCFFYGVTVDWNDTMFGPKVKAWNQVKIVANGEYTVTENNGDSNNITFEIIIHQS